MTSKMYAVNQGCRAWLKPQCWAIPMSLRKVIKNFTGSFKYCAMLSGLLGCQSSATAHMLLKAWKRLNNHDYCTVKSLSLFWFAEIIQWILEIMSSSHSCVACYREEANTWLSFFITKQLLNSGFGILGDSRKYPYHTTDGFHILTPLAFRISKMCYPPMPSDFHNREPPPPLPFRISIFSVRPIKVH